MPRKTRAMREIEKRLGRPLEEVIPELYGRYGTEDGVGRALGITRHTLYTWRGLLGIEIENRRVASTPAAGN